MKKNALIIFDSCYGSTERYAEWLASALDVSALYRHSCNFADLEEQNLDYMIYGGGLYANRLRGGSWLRKLCRKFPQKKIILFTCGLGDPADPKNVEHIKHQLRRQLGEKNLERLAFFPLRGGVDYARMSRWHHFLMTMLRNRIASKPAETISADERLILDTYGKTVDLCDRASIEPVLNYINNMERGDRS